MIEAGQKAMMYRSIITIFSLHKVLACFLRMVMLQSRMDRYYTLQAFNTSTNTWEDIENTHTKKYDVCKEFLRKHINKNKDNQSFRISIKPTGFVPWCLSRNKIDYSSSDLETQDKVIDFCLNPTILGIKNMGKYSFSFYDDVGYYTNRGYLHNFYASTEEEYMEFLTYRMVLPFKLSDLSKETRSLVFEYYYSKTRYLNGVFKTSDGEVCIFESDIKRWFVDLLIRFLAVDYKFDGETTWSLEDFKEFLVVRS